MNDEPSFSETMKLVEARSHPFKVKLIQLLQIYGELSTLDFVKKTGKSKPTILKHLGELEKLGELGYKEIISPGAFDKRIYFLKNKSVPIKGQNLRGRLNENPNIAIEYNNFRHSIIVTIKEVIDSIVQYQERLSNQVEEAVDKGQRSEVFELMKDHWGQLSQEYVSKHELFGVGEEEPKSYMKLELIIPIQRIIEQLSQSNWNKDGMLWPL